ncbi:MAG: phosphatidylserine/phosphatidylglycerophosphate/cardiolipin synthase [Cyanobacteria bacterium RYN_339]|nr:phosphatidylserine/phosphatidylglycerophosphate/cardiolipin synthase [Cyanobacteria bacterium RYN_339]
MQLTHSRLFHDRRHHRARWPWWVLGIGFLLLYLQGAFRVRVNLVLTDMPGTQEARFLPAIAGLTTSIITDGHFTNFWSDIDQIFASRLELIRQAQHTVRFETYYMTPGRRADDLAAAMLERAAHGVKVALIVDSQGSLKIPGAYWDKLKAGGVEVRWFSPFDWKNPRLYNDRSHRKLLLVDGTVAQIGGAGVSDDWDGTAGKEHTAPWADLEVRANGPLVPVLEGAFLQHWIHEAGVGDMTPEAFKAPAATGHPVLVTLGDPSHGDSNMRTLMHAAILAARKRLWVASPYFLPNTNARNTFIEARKRGVEVRILTEGPRNDNPFAYQGARSSFADLLKAGVEIDEYQPSMMHAKAILVDDAWMSTGSANFDPRALFHNDELNVSASDPALAQQLGAFFTQAFAKSHRVTEQDLANRNPLERAEGGLGYLYRWQL